MILVDYSGFSITSIMGYLGGDNTAEITPSTFRNIFLNSILEYKKKYGERFGEIVFAIDNRNYWRRAVYSWYKVYRNKTRDDQGYDWDMIHQCMDVVKEEIKEFFPYAVVDCSFAEADDVIMTLVEYLQENELDMFDEPQEILVVASDTDLVQTQKYKNVKQYSPYTKAEVKPTLTRGKEKVRVKLPEFVIDHILTGDAGDSIPNILTEDDFYQKKLDNPDTKYKQASITQKVRDFYVPQWVEHGDIIEFRSEAEEKAIKRNKLMVLMESIPDRVKEKVIDAYVKQKGKDRRHMLNYFVDKDLRNLMEKVQEF